METSGSINQVCAGWKLWFAKPDFSGELQFPEESCFRLISGFFSAMEKKGQYSVPEVFLNALDREYSPKTLAETLYHEAFRELVRRRIMPEELHEIRRSAHIEFLLRHFYAILSYLSDLPNHFPHNVLAPAVVEMLQGLAPADLESVAMRLAACDEFAVNRVFGYRQGRFYTVHPDSLRPVDSFFGFPGVRILYENHFRDFAAGKTNLPLLINSLPGYGKTSMTISYALSQPGIVVILPEPEALEEGWSELISSLSTRCDHKFVLFFDDIDPGKVDWYSFRTNVGGAFSTPKHIMPVLSANYEFPPSILSRGLRLSYPVFDELRCTEMVEDFLRHFGLKQPTPNLVSLIGADYTEEFSQKKFTELSPRTLVRYLAGFEHDPKRRRTIVALSQGQLITRPDAELFYEFNIELMRSLYGEEYIQRLLKERLREL